MNTVFIIRNQHNQVLTRQEEWATINEAANLFTAKHRDQAINTLVEVNTHQFEMRCEINEVPLTDKGKADLSQLPPLTVGSSVNAEAGVAPQDDNPASEAGDTEAESEA